MSVCVCDSTVISPAGGGVSEQTHLRWGPLLQPHCRSCFPSPLFTDQVSTVASKRSCFLSRSLPTTAAASGTCSVPMTRGHRRSPVREAAGSLFESSCDVILPRISRTAARGRVQSHTWCFLLLMEEEQRLQVVSAEGNKKHTSY